MGRPIFFALDRMKETEKQKIVKENIFFVLKFPALKYLEPDFVAVMGTSSGTVSIKSKKIL